MTGEQLQQYKKAKEDYYKTIKEVIIPEPFQNMKVFIGGCSEHGVGSSFYAKAHAHNYKGSPHFGDICIRSIKRLGKYEEIKNEDGTVTLKVTKMSQLLLHEIAHILAPGQGHTKTWLNRFIEIGATKGTIDKCKKRWKSCN